MSDKISSLRLSVRVLLSLITYHLSLITPSSLITYHLSLITSTFSLITYHLSLITSPFSLRLSVKVLLALITYHLSPITSFAQDDPTFVPTVKVGKALVDGDSIQYMELSKVYVYPEPTFKSKRQQKAYMRLVRNVKKVLPIAKEVRQIIIETAEFTETLPPSERKDHLKRVESAIVRDYKPKMKKLTFSQGKLLIKLIDRECNSTAYEAMQAFIGPVRSGMWQAFAWMFGASLKKGYDPDGVDRLTERVVLMVESGQI